MGVTDRLLAQIEMLKADNARLEKEADWLVDNISGDECPYQTCDWENDLDDRPQWCDWHYDIFYGEYDCSGGVVECWRKVAREAVEEKCQK